MLESGTVNLPGILGIGAGIDFIKSKGIDNIYRHENALCKKFLKDVSQNKNISVILRNEKDVGFVPVIAFNVRGKKSEEVAESLNSFGIAVRGGYHCAPLAHRALGTIDGGAVRVSPGILNRFSDMEYLRKAIFSISH
jgi:selenocysteine lyase/cysteine desulfurase